HRREDLLARPVPAADGHPHDLATVVLSRLVAQPDRRGLPAALELVDEDRRVEGEDVESARQREPERGAYRRRYSWGYPAAPMSGTKRQAAIVRRRYTASSPGPDAGSRSQRIRRSSPKPPPRSGIVETGATSRPPGASCARSSCGS